MEELQFYRDRNVDFFEIKEGCCLVPAEKPHCHRQVAIGVIESGTSQVSCQGEDFAVGDGHIVVFPPNVMHKCTPKDVTDWKFKMLYVEPAWIKGVFGTAVPVLATIKPLPALAIDEVKAGFSFLELPADANAKETALILLLEQIFALTDIRVCEPLPTSSEAAAVLKAYIEDHYWQSISLDEMAALVHATKFHLIRQFDRSYGMPPHAYLMQLRMSQAKEMLRDDMDIKDIALSLGFFDQSHFTRAFKQYVGVTPGEYRRAD